MSSRYQAAEVFKTYKEWRLLNREVLTHSVPHGWTWNNYALYTISQTKELT
jgi:hypothetical protein